MSAMEQLRGYAAYLSRYRPAVRSITVALTPRYCRRMLGIPKDEALVFHGFALRCIGSKRWRAGHYKSRGD